MEIQEWAKRAACQGAKPEIFITVGDADDELYYPSDEAMAYCNRCPVRPECLAWALADPELLGVWGGTTSYQRRQLRRARERASCPGCASSDLVIEGTVELCLGCGASWFVL